MMTERSAGNDTNVSSEPTDGSAGQPKRYAHGSVQIAEACAAAICDGEWKVMQKYTNQDGITMMLGVPEGLVAERLAKTLDAIHTDKA